MWIISYDVADRNSEGEETGRVRRGFFVEPDPVMAHLRYEMGLRQEPGRNYKLEEAHHFEMAARPSIDQEAMMWQLGLELGVNCRDLILRWTDYR